MFVSENFIQYNFKDLPMDAESNWNNLPKKSKETIIHRLEFTSKEGDFNVLTEAPLVFYYLPGIFVQDAKDYHWNLWQAKRSAYILSADFWIKGKRIETVLMLFYATFLEESLARGMDVVTSYFRDDSRFERTSKAISVEYTDDKKNILFDIVDMYSHFAFLHRAIMDTKTGKDMIEFLVARLKEHPGTSKWIGQISRMKHVVAKVHTEDTSLLEEAKPRLMKLTCLAGSEYELGKYFDLYVYQDTLYNWVSNVVLTSYRLNNYKLLTGSMSKVKPRQSFRLPSLMCYSKREGGGVYPRIFYTVTSRMKTMNQLGIQDGDMISHVQFTQSGNNNNNNAAATKSTVGRNRNNSSGKGKKQKKTRKAKSNAPTKSKQEQLVNDQITLREAHSKSMELVLNELRPLLKIRRDKIASYYLQKAPPKVKRSIKTPTKSDTHLMTISSNVPLIGGKAGKSVYPVLVGEVANLYKSSKKKFRSLSTSQNRIITLDLHACSRYKALGVLRKHLPKWIDAAMKGDHPFVIPVDIVCGGGNQVLSELVAQFIRDNPQIANRPRSKL